MRSISWIDNEYLVIVYTGIPTLMLHSMCKYLTDLLQQYELSSRMYFPAFWQRNIRQQISYAHLFICIHILLYYKAAIKRGIYCSLCTYSHYFDQSKFSNFLLLYMANAYKSQFWVGSIMFCRICYFGITCLCKIFSKVSSILPNVWNF